MGCNMEKKCCIFLVLIIALKSQCYYAEGRHQDATMEFSSYSGEVRPAGSRSVDELSPASHSSGDALRRRVDIEETSNITKRPNLYAIHSVIPRSRVEVARTIMNIWNPKLARQSDFSSGMVFLEAGQGDDANFIEAGWHVYPELYNDNQTRFYVLWTRDNFNYTGCYNLRCPGFVQTYNKSINSAPFKDSTVGANGTSFIGAPLKYSTIGGEDYFINICIRKDVESGNWLLYLQNTEIGYWPKSIFTALKGKAESVSWGGGVYDSSGLRGRGSSTEMGSGQRPSQSYGGSVENKGFVYQPTYNSQHPTRTNILPTVTAPRCYNIAIRGTGQYPSSVYGGPGCG